MKTFRKCLAVTTLLMVCATLPGCGNPQVYGTIGISSGYSNHGGRGGWNPRVHTSISVGGRIH
jgi:hypothetical protein